MKIRKQIKQRRRKIGMTQRHIATRVGVTRSAYANWENGYRPLVAARLKQIERVLRRHFG